MGVCCYAVKTESIFINVKDEKELSQAIRITILEIKRSYSKEHLINKNSILKETPKMIKGNPKEIHKIKHDLENIKKNILNLSLLKYLNLFEKRFSQEVFEDFDFIKMKFIEYIDVTLLLSEEELDSLSINMLNILDQKQRKRTIDHNNSMIII